MSRVVTQDDLFSIMQSFEDRFNAIMLALRTTVPTGGMIVWPSAVAIPEGWLRCNGSAIDNNLYPVLRQMVGANTPNLAAPSGSTFYIIKT